MSQPRQSKLDDLNEILHTYAIRVISLKPTEVSKEYQSLKDETKTALNQYMLDSFLELIGEDAPQPLNNLDFGKNELRNQLRQAAKERYEQ